MLATLYFNGEGVKQDYAKSRYWFTKAANKGEVHAQYWLARIFEFGLGTNRDLTRALSLYKTAADHGLAEAMNALGECLCQSEDPMDREQGLFWIKKAADLDCAEAKYNLALYRQKLK